MQRHESCSILLHGRAEFEASSVVLRGDYCFEVPDGYRMNVTTGLDGQIRQSIEPLKKEPSWQWQYTMDAKQNVQLHLETASTPHISQPKFDAAELSYMI